MELSHKYKGIICRGCYELGTACGHCEKCKDQRKARNEPSVPVSELEELIAYGRYVGSTTSVSVRLQALIDKAKGGE